MNYQYYIDFKASIDTAKATHWQATQHYSKADVLVMRKGKHPSWLKRYKSLKMLTPIIYVGAESEAEEFHLPELDGDKFCDLLQFIEPIVENIKQLPHDITHAIEENYFLATAAFAWTRNQRVNAIINASTPLGYLYPISIDHVDAELLLFNLYEAKLMDREFADAAYSCPKCKSIKILLREGCPQCQSVNIKYETIILHKQCGYRGPESSFLKITGLYVCPECNTTLKSATEDYEKAGSLIICKLCDYQARDPIMAGKCLQCSHQFTINQSTLKPIYNYVLNSAGVKALFNLQVNAYNPIQLLGSELNTIDITSFSAIARKFYKLAERQETYSFVIQVKIKEDMQKTISLNERVKLLIELSEETAKHLREYDLVTYYQDVLFILLVAIDQQKTELVFERLKEEIKDKLPKDVFKNLSFEHYSILEMREVYKD